ncbi:MAG: UbiA family prenyltransferase [Nocardioides sp.]
MKFRKRRGTPAALVLTAHPVPAAVLAAVLTAAAAGSGRPARECALVAVTVLTGQLTVGWVSDLADRHRDREVGRQDRPLAMGWVDPGTVAFVVACATLLVIPLSIANGTAAGLAHLGAVVAGWIGALWLRRTWLSWLPWAISFGLYPAFLSYGGWGGGLHGAPPTLAVTALAALLGVGVHVLLALPDLVEDKATGLQHLPLRIALRIGAPRLLVLAGALTAVVAAGLVAAAVTVGLRQ